MTYDEFTNMDYRMRVEYDNNQYKITIVELNIHAFGNTVNDALTNLNDVKINYYNSIENKDEIPYSEDKEHSGVFRMRVPKSLHKELSINAKTRNMSLNQYCIELLKQG